MVKPYYIYGCLVYYIYGQILLHLWLVDSLYWWLKVITFMVSITFMGDTDAAFVYEFVLGRVWHFLSIFFHRKINVVLYPTLSYLRFSVKLSLFLLFI